MYKLSDERRRITAFIRTEARKWLYDKLNNYKPNSVEARDLYMQIKKVGGIDESKYKRFTELFGNNPFTGMINGIADDNHSISSDDLHMYFINYNKHVLPIGFIFDFFEDEFGESERDRENEILDGFLDWSRAEIRTKWESSKYESGDAISTALEKFTSIKEFGVRKLLWCVAWVISLGLLCHCICHYAASNSITNALLEFAYQRDFHALSSHLQTMAFPTVVAAIGLVFLLSQISFIAHMIKVSYLKLRFHAHMRLATLCEEIGSEEIEHSLKAFGCSFLRERKVIRNIRPYTKAEKMFDKLQKYNVKLSGLEGKKKHISVVKTVGNSSLRLRTILSYSLVMASIATKLI